MRVFVSAMGQYDNVGDTALRRAFLDALRPYGPLTVFVGSRPPGYIAGLGLTDADTIVRTSPAWRTELMKGARSGMLYAHNAGEIELEFQYALRYLRLLPILALNRASKGVNIHIGLGVRSATRWRRVVTGVLRLMNVVAWRDDWSRRYMSIGGYSPDWAFATGSSVDELLDSAERSILAVSIRYNGTGIAPELVAAIRDTAQSLALKPLVVAQIKRDEPLARELAELVGGEALPWDDDHMQRQEQRIRAVYRESEAVISDRLHALVFGVTEGALPIALSTDPKDKATRTLQAAGITLAGFDRSEIRSTDLTAILSEAPRKREELLTALSAARMQIERTRATVTSLTER